MSMIHIKNLMSTIGAKLNSIKIKSKSQVTVSLLFT